jgi:hypothetical protein
MPPQGPQGGGGGGLFDYILQALQGMGYGQEGVAGDESMLPMGLRELLMLLQGAQQGLQQPLPQAGSFTNQNQQQLLEQLGPNY